MSLKGIVSSLPKSGWSTLENLLSSGSITSSEANSSGLVKNLVSYIKKHKELDHASSAIASLAQQVSGVADAIIREKFLDVVMSDNQKKWSDKTKENIAKAVAALAKQNSIDTFRAFDFLMKMLADGPVNAREYAAEAAQTFCSVSSLKSEIVNSSKLKVICEGAERGMTVGIQRPCMSGLNYISSGSNQNGLDKKMFTKGVFSTIAYVMNNVEDGPTLSDCLCFTRNATLTSEDIKVYLCEKGSGAINKALKHKEGSVREHAGGLIRNLGTNGAQSNYRKTCLIDSGVLRTMTEVLETDKHQGALLQSAYGLWNLSNSAHGSKTILEGGLVPRIIAVYEKVPWSQYLNGECYKNKLVGLLCCLCANAGEEGCNELRKFGLQDHLHPLMMSKDPNKQPINAACGLANLVGHLENHPLLKADTTIFEMMCDCIEATRRGEAYHGAYYSEWGLIRNLANMSVSDSNKPLLKKTNSVECACKGFRVGEKYIKLEECVAKLISNMSFSFDLETEFDCDVVSVIKSIQSNSKSEEARRLADVALFQQRQKKEKPAEIAAKREKPAGNANDQHIMISYPWKYQPQMLALKEYLEGEGLSVWFDLDDMSGSTLDAMATAVEGSFAVIVCMCAEYKESAACRSEGEYAFNLRKPIIPVKPDMSYNPDGWLGMLLGSKLYFDVSCEDSFSKNCPQIIKEIQKHKSGKGGKQPGGHNTTTKTPSSPSKTPAYTAPAPSSTKSNTGSGSGVDAATLQTVLDTFLKNVEQMRTNIEKRIDERFDALDARLRKLEGK